VNPGFPEVPSLLAGGDVDAVNNPLGVGQAAFVAAGLELAHQLAGREARQIRMERRVRTRLHDPETLGRGSLQFVFEGLASGFQPTFAVAETALLVASEAVIDLTARLAGAL
jgi:hypothetical protein